MAPSSDPQDVLIYFRSRTLPPPTTCLQLPEQDDDDDTTHASRSALRKVFAAWVEATVFSREVAAKIAELLPKHAKGLVQRLNETGNLNELVQDHRHQQHLHRHNNDYTVQATIDYDILTWAYMLCATIQVLLKDKKFVTLDGTITAATHLYQLLQFSSHIPYLADEISKICELFWIEERPQHPTMALDVLRFLLNAFQNEKPSLRTALIKRIYAIRKTIPFIYKTHANSTHAKLRPLLAQILHTCVHTDCLRLAEGRKLTAFVIASVPYSDTDENRSSCHANTNTIPNSISIFHSIPMQFHQQLLTVVASANAERANWIGEVYFRAWKSAYSPSAPSPLLAHIESNLIQDIMKKAIYLSNPKITHNLKLLLMAFHAQKRIQGVDPMLFRLYEPILFKSLKLPNPKIRYNATKLFTDAFPLCNPDTSMVELASAMEDQFSLLESLLNDPIESIREVSIQGVSRILATFWELIPVAQKKTFLLKLVNELAFDASSPQVRGAVLEGLRAILKNHMSHLALKDLLPVLAPLIHDKSERVRISFLEILVRVKEIKAIRFFDIVSVDELLYRLTCDKDAVVIRICHLLSNSFFPLKVKYGPAGQVAAMAAAATTGGSGAEVDSEEKRVIQVQQERLFKMLNTDVKAARAFYSRIPFFAPLNKVCNFIKALTATLLSSAAHDKVESRALKRSRAEVVGENKKEVQENEEQDGSNNNNNMSRSGSAMRYPTYKFRRDILYIIGEAWVNLGPTLRKEQDKKLASYMWNYFDEKRLMELMELFPASDSIQVQAQIWKIGSQLPHQRSSMLFSEWTNEFKYLCKLFNHHSSNKKPNVGLIEFLHSIFECVVNWKQEREFMILLCGWIKTYVSEVGSGMNKLQYGSPRCKKRSRDKKSDSKDESIKNQAKMSLFCMEYIANQTLMNSSSSCCGSSGSLGVLYQEYCSEGVMRALKALFLKSLLQAEKLLVRDRMSPPSSPAAHDEATFEILLRTISLYCNLCLSRATCGPGKAVTPQIDKFVLSSRAELETLEYLERVLREWEEWEGPGDNDDEEEEKEQEQEQEQEQDQQEDLPHPRRRRRSSSNEEMKMLSPFRELVDTFAADTSQLGSCCTNTDSSEEYHTRYLSYVRYRISRMEMHGYEVRESSGYSLGRILVHLWNSTMNKGDWVPASHSISATYPYSGTCNRSSTLTRDLLDVTTSFLVAFDLEEDEEEENDDDGDGDEKNRPRPRPASGPVDFVLSFLHECLSSVSRGDSGRSSGIMLFSELTRHILSRLTMIVPVNGEVDMNGVQDNDLRRCYVADPQKYQNAYRVLEKFSLWSSEDQHQEQLVKHLEEMLVASWRGPTGSATSRTTIPTDPPADGWVRSKSSSLSRGSSILLVGLLRGLVDKTIKQWLELSARRKQKLRELYVGLSQSVEEQSVSCDVMEQVLRITEKISAQG